MSPAPWWEQFDALPDRAPTAADPPTAADHAAAGPRAAPGGPSVVVRPDAPPTLSTPAPPAGAAPARPAGPPAVVRRPDRGERPLKVLAALLGVVLLVLLGLLAVRSAGSTGGSAAAGPTAAGSSAAPPSGASTADDPPTAELRALRDEGIAAHRPRGQWVAQLAAKSVGTTDPVQTATNGSNTFYAADILAQTRSIAAGVAGEDVFVLRSTDYGQRSVDARGNPFWVTFADGPFADADDVRTWCASVFAATPADDRGNVCYPQQLTAPAGSAR